jgi:hypothetical protein
VKTRSTIITVDVEAVGALLDVRGAVGEEAWIKREL